MPPVNLTASCCILVSSYNRTQSIRQLAAVVHEDAFDHRDYLDQHIDEDEKKICKNLVGNALSKWTSSEILKFINSKSNLLDVSIFSLEHLKYRHLDHHKPNLM